LQILSHKLFATIRKVKRKVCKSISMKAKEKTKHLFAFLFLLICLQASDVHAQRNLFDAQRELIGSKLWYLEFTEWLANKPSDSSYSKKIKVLEFWATWCKPCLKAIPHMNSLQESFADSNIVFFSITHQTSKDVKTTLEKYNFETIVVSDSTG